MEESDLGDLVNSMITKLNRLNRNKKIKKKNCKENPIKYLVKRLICMTSSETKQDILSADYPSFVGGKIEDVDPDKKMEPEVPGEFYEPDPEILEILQNKVVLTKKSLSNLGIYTSLDSLCEREARDENANLSDRQLVEAGINNLKQKYCS